MAILAKTHSFLSNLNKVYRALQLDPEYQKSFYQDRISFAENSKYSLSEEEKAKQNLAESAPHFRRRKIDYIVLVMALILHACEGVQNSCHQSSPIFLQRYQELITCFLGDSSFTLHVNSIKKALSNPQTEVALDAVINYLTELILSLEIDKEGHIHELFHELMNDLGRTVAVDGSYIATVGNKHGAKLHAVFDCVCNKLHSFIISEGHESERTHALEMFLELAKQGQKLLVLADAGYYGFELMERISEAGSYFLFKGRKNTACNGATVVMAVNEKGKEIKQFKGKTLQKCSTNAKFGQVIDFILKDSKGKEYRVIRARKPNEDARKNKRAAYVYFLTNIPLEEYSGSFLSFFYHFRWTVENFFKDLKSGNSLQKSTFKNPFTIRVLIKASIAACLFKYFFAYAVEVETNTRGTHSIHKIMRYTAFPADEIIYFILQSSHKKSIRRKLEHQSFYQKLINFLKNCKTTKSSQRTKEAIKDLNFLADELLKNKKEYSLIWKKIKSQIGLHQNSTLVEKYASF